MTHYKKNRCTNSWICLLWYTFFYFLNSLQRNIYQCYKKKNKLQPPPLKKHSFWC